MLSHGYLVMLCHGLLALASPDANTTHSFVHLPHGGALRGSLGLNNERWFRGIPYGQPPTGDLRFRPPLPAHGWSGVRDALEYGSPCLQPVYPAGGWASIENTANASEDCLFVNVVAPAAVEGGRPWPVIVYLPAGEFHVRHSLPPDGALAPWPMPA